MRRLNRVWMTVIATLTPGNCPKNPDGGDHNMESDGPHDMRCTYCGYLQQY